MKPDELGRALFKDPVHQIRTLAIDPGTTHSGVVLWDPWERRVQFVQQQMENEVVRINLLELWKGHRVVVEWIQSMGMAVGREVFDTARFVGRLEEICLAREQPFTLIQRPTVKTRLCGSPRAKDPNVRQALLDMFGSVGTKKAPGPLYGVSGHAWQALAVAVAVDIQ